MNATSGLGATPDDVCHLVSLGLLESPTVAFQASDAAGTDAIFGATAAAERPSATLAFSPDGLPTLAAQAQYSKAYPIATRLTVGLGLRGFRLNLAVEAAGDLNKLKDLALRIKEAVGPEKFLEHWKCLVQLTRFLHASGHAVRITAVTRNIEHWSSPLCSPLRALMQWNR